MMNVFWFIDVGDLSSLRFHQIAVVKRIGRKRPKETASLRGLRLSGVDGGGDVCIERGHLVAKNK